MTDRTGVELQAFEVVFENIVDDTAHRVRAVHRGASALHDLDALEQADRDHVGARRRCRVHAAEARTAEASGGRRITSTVHQRQRARRPAPSPNSAGYCSPPPLLSPFSGDRGRAGVLAVVSFNA